MSKKIHAAKTESAASVIGKVLNSPDDEVILYVPKGGTFGKSRNDFLLLKRETRVIGKVVEIESVDDDILELAATSGLKAVNPFLGKKQKAVSDIVVMKEESPLGGRRIVTTDEYEGKEEEGAHKDAKPVEVPVTSGRRFWFHLPRRKEKKSFGLDDGGASSLEDYEEAKEDASLKTKRERKKLKWSTIIAGILGLVIVFVILATWVFPRVTVALNFEKKDWAFVGSLNVGTAITDNEFANDTIDLRGMSFSEKKNFTESYPATGEEFVERRAKGTMIVYNAYSSEPQELVERTRFTTPDGKIYRMDRGVTVPGAIVVGGEITPSSVEVTVTADEPGEEYNIDPVPRFRIPGFQGTPKYDGFYGESKEPITGGFVGERKIATESDIASARENIIKTLEDSAKTQLFLNLPEGTKVIDETYKFEITDEVVDEGSSDSDTFSITIYGEAKIIVFLEEELVEVFEDRVEDENGVDLIPKEYSVEYGEPRVNDAGNGFSVAISVDSTWVRPFDMEQFKSSAAGKSKEELETLIFTIPGVDGGKVSFWPFWVGRVPDKPERVFVDVN